MQSIAPQLCKLRRDGFVVRLWPSGDFSVGRQAPPRADTGYDPLGGWREADEFDAIAHKVTQVDADGVVSSTGVVWQARQPEAQDITCDDLLQLADKAFEAGNEALGERFLAGLGAASDRQEASAKLGLSVASKSHKGVARGEKGITTYGKRMVRSAAAILQKSGGRERLQFGTATLPVLSQDDMRAVCSHWAEIVRQFGQELQRMMKRRGIENPRWLYVTELQERRWKWDGQIVPHLHWIIEARATSRSMWAIRPDEVSALWDRLLSNALGREVQARAGTNIQAPRKSLNKELGKYLSKGGKILHDVVQAGRGGELPASWWGASLSLKREVKKSVKSLYGESAMEFVENLEKHSQSGNLAYRKIMVELKDERSGSVREICVGYVGYLIENRALIRLVA